MALRLEAEPPSVPQSTSIWSESSMISAHSMGRLGLTGGKLRTQIGSPIVLILAIIGLSPCLPAMYTLPSADLHMLYAKSSCCGLPSVFTKVTGFSQSPQRFFGTERLSKLLR